MKRAKIALTAIGVFAIVGGALAFKAAKFGAQVYCANPQQSQVCNLTKLSFTTAPQPGQAGILSSCTTAPTNVTCRQTTIYSLQ